MFFLGCGDSSFEDKGRTFYLSSEERGSLATNELFEAILDRKNIIEIQDILNQNGDELFSMNGYGDTPLGVAIKTYNEKASLYLISQLTPDHLLHQNYRGETYVYLAAQQGYADIISHIADQFYKHDDALSDYEFSDIDQPALNGEKALHIAKNQNVAEVLNREYYRGALEFPIRKFQYHLTEDTQSFLHTAVRDDRVSVLRWATQQHCVTENTWETSPFYYQLPMYLFKGLDSYLVYVDWGLADIVNLRDYQGNTPMNLAAKYLLTDAVRLLSTCLWLDYLLPNDKGDIPLQTFLKSLDPHASTQPDDIKDAFTLLAESRTRFTLKELRDHIDYINLEGDSSLHLAAQVADPFFFNYLKKYGNTEQKNLKNQTPQALFEQTQSQISYTRKK